jgi:acyl-[acyl-carrier-protein]-phospholipid O-acyltransferase/long-chain-fatty-acid--[acyl-carrier-protein] ligase
VEKLSASERILRLIGLGFVRTFYRVTVTGTESLPSGGFLLLPNHITWIDAILLSMACPRPIRFIIDEGVYRNPWLNPVLRAVSCIPITGRKAKDGMREAISRIRAGEIVCLFPEGELTRTGALLRLRRGYEIIARQAEAPVVPVWLDQLWGSIFSYKGGRFFTKLPKAIPYRVTVAFGEALTADEADTATVREQLLKLGEFCYSQRPNLRGHIGRAALRGLKRHRFRTGLVDGMDGSQLVRGKVLGVALAFARHLQKTYPDQKRIGVVLPPGKGGLVANLSIILAGKIPVNLNFTSLHEAIVSAIDQAGLKTTITAHAMEKRLVDFPWTSEVVYLDDALPPMKKKILLWWIAALFVPRGILAGMMKLPSVGDHDEAVLLFTSGSSGKPKGVVLSHRNILGNVAQFAVALDARKTDLLLASLPFFHSFGCTVTLFYPLFESVRALTYPNPLEAKKIAELIHRHHVTVMLATPTFLRAYLRKAEPEQLSSLRLLVAGAEKLPLDLGQAVEARFGKHVYEGYGLTETSPVISVNLPEPPGQTQPTNRPGSTGKMLSGIAAEIRDPETEEKRSLHETGMLWVRGPNIFEGYLDAPEQNADVLRNGWFKTGDIGRFDEDGFLYIEGRLSRFSKMAGEMVPHETIETKILHALNIGEQGERVLAVMGVPDAIKGEALVLLTTIEIDQHALRSALTATGVPNLWIPRTIYRVEAIPALASGKLDLVGCKKLAEEAVSGARSTPAAAAP